ncbi:MAG TPA: 30S ribosomal protein S20 [Planctomycetota bacterium]|nr:30S ribosomal protein S20 [Planctomycetota bacterium]
MAHSRTAKKNIRKNEARHERNKAAVAAMRTQVKRVRTAVAAGDRAGAAREFAKAQQLADKAAKRNRVHKNTAARIKSRLAVAVNSLAGK